MKKVMWKEVVGFPDYQINKSGTVRRKKAPYKRNTPKDYVGRTLRWNVMRDGYAVVTLFKESRRHVRLVHILVLETFIELKPNKHLECAHEDSNRLNNHVSNLRWATKIQNAQDKIYNGSSLYGEMNPKVILTEKNVIEILRSKKTHEFLAKKYGVARVTISSITCGRTWKHIDRSSL